jgi:opacity protein-like surface antigen
MYIWLGNEKAIPVEGLPGALNLNNNLNTLTLTPEIAYRLLAGKRGAVDFLVGVRYYHADAKIKATVSQVGQVSYSAADNWVDAIQGARFQFNLSQRVGAFFIGDAGGGGSRLSWQIATGIGYRLNTHWTSQFGYRRLSYQRQSGPNFGLDQTQQGLILGITYRLK